MLQLTTLYLYCINSFFFLLLQEYIFRMMDDWSILACRQYSGVVAVMSKGEIQLLPPVPPGWGADADRASSTFKQCSQTHCTSMNTDCISLLVNVRSCFHSAFPHTLSLLCPEWIALGRHLQDKVNFLGFLSWRLKWRKRFCNIPAQQIPQVLPVFSNVVWIIANKQAKC